MKRLVLILIALGSLSSVAGECEKKLCPLAAITHEEQSESIDYMSSLSKDFDVELPSVVGKAKKVNIQITIFAERDRYNAFSRSLDLNDRSLEEQLIKFYNPASEAMSKALSEISLELNNSDELNIDSDVEVKFRIETNQNGDFKDLVEI